MEHISTVNKRRRSPHLYVDVWLAHMRMWSKTMSQGVLKAIRSCLVLGCAGVLYRVCVAWQWFDRCMCLYGSLNIHYDEWSQSARKRRGVELEAFWVIFICMPLLGPFLSNNFFSRFSSFFPKQEKQEIFSNFGKLTERKISGTLSIPVFGIKHGKSGNKKKCAIFFFWIF